MLSWWRHKPSSLALINGVIAGLAGVTPASGYINTQWTILLGFILGVTSYFAVILMKFKVCPLLPLRVMFLFLCSFVFALSSVYVDLFLLLFFYFFLFFCKNFPIKIHFEPIMIRLLLLFCVFVFSCFNLFLVAQLRVDDALDVSSVHGLTGAIGSIFIGFASQLSVNPDQGADGLFYGNHRCANLK